MIKLYDLLMSLSYDWNSNPMKFDKEDYEDKDHEGQINTPPLPVKINFSSDWILLPGNYEEREAYIEKELINCEVNTVTVLIKPQKDGRIIPVVEIFTDDLHPKPFN